MQNRVKQGGLSLMTFLMWGIIVAFLAVVGIRVVPAYAEYFEVKKTLDKTIRDFDGTNIPLARRDFDLKSSAGYIESVKGTDLQFSRDRGQLIISVAWERKLHLFGNASLLLEFDAAAAK